MTQITDSGRSDHFTSPEKVHHAHKKEILRSRSVLGFVSDLQLRHKVYYLTVVHFPRERPKLLTPFCFSQHLSPLRMAVENRASQQVATVRHDENF